MGDPAFEALRELLARPAKPLPEEAVLATGLPELDQALSGGFPRGGIATFEGPASAGASTLVARLLAVATGAGDLAALVEGPSRHAPFTLAAAGVRLDRVVIVPAASALDVVRAADILLRAGTFAVVAIPLPAPSPRKAWPRLARLAERANGLLTVAGCEPPDELRASATVRLELALGTVRFRGEPGLFGELAGYDVRACVRKHRRAPPGGSATIRCEPFDSRPGAGPFVERVLLSPERRC